MYFKLDIHEKNGDCFFVTENTVVNVSSAYSEFIEKTVKTKLVSPPCGKEIKSISYKLGFTASIKKKISDSGNTIYSNEAYAIVIGDDTRIYAKSESGFIYATATLNQLKDHGELEGGFVYDAPIADIRGYRVYLPSRSGFSSFFEMLDFLAYYKFNSIILEIGGAMEYKRHPEINEKWAEFCREVHAYSGRAIEIQQKTYPWHKNSIHCDNAEGDILTQEECRLIADECRKRGLEPIPECPTFSHCDYIVMAHPEIRERKADGHPDTYCPNHPDTYGYVFDILEEVIDVFNPKQLNIGHDEMYSIGLCDKCKHTPAYILYANDVIKINDFLKARGIKTLMWGEKLLKAHLKTGEACGGSGHGKGTWKVPALFPCRDLIPKDITILHWYWSLNPDYDMIYHKRGIKAIYGNLSPLMTLKNWNLRRKRGINGGFVSNWGSFGEEYMQRNQQYIDLILAAYGFWCDDFQERGEENAFNYAAKEAYRLKCSKIKNPIKITHTSKSEIPYAFFYDGEFIVDEKFLLGNYEISYSDGTTASLPVKYGTHVGFAEFKNALHQGGFLQLTYGTLPIKRGDSYVYEAVYEDPSPEKSIISIKYSPVTGKESFEIELFSFTKEV